MLPPRASRSAAPASLGEWLAFIERQHSKPVDLTLERARTVLGRLALRFSFRSLTVAGTNGKGSVCAMLDSILRASGYRTAFYSSPHLLRYNERVRIGGEEASDASLCEAFAAVEAARDGVPLTYFEFGTLAALWLFTRAEPQVVVLEVGLGGRLDTVNLVDPDVAIVTTVGVDHVEYLGPTREDIGREKAGIFRPGRPAICGDADPPRSLLDVATQVGADLRLIDRDFGFAAENGQWRYWSRSRRRGGLPLPALRGRFQLGNAATALAALEAIGADLPVSAGAVRAGLLDVDWPARFQVLPGQPTVVLDVAHNPAAAKVLAESLAAMGAHGRRYAVFGVLADKDVAGIVRALGEQVDRWLVATLEGPRGVAAPALRAALVAAGVDAARVSEHDSPALAFAAAREQCRVPDRIIVFGSFLTVAAVMEALADARKR